MKPRNRHGFTLTEIAIVLGIVGIVLGLIWVAASAVYKNYQVNTAVEELQTISNNISGLYATRSVTTTAYFADITCFLVTAGVFPSKMISQPCIPGNGYTYPQQPWGFVKVEAQGNCPPCSTNSFEVEFLSWASQVGTGPSVPCAAFVSRVAGPNADTKLISVFEGGNDVWAWLTPTTILPTTINPLCNYDSFAYTFH